MMMQLLAGTSLGEAKGGGGDCDSEFSNMYGTAMAWRGSDRVRMGRERGG
jgi:hypothetical protein